MEIESRLGLKVSLWARMSTLKKVGLLYVANRTCSELANEILGHLGKDNVISYGIKEKNATADKLTHTGGRIKNHIRKADSFIVIVDDVHWDTFWNEKTNKIPNKLEELLDDDDDDDDDDDEDDGESSDTASKNHKFIMVVGINTDKKDKITKKEFNEYLGSQSISSKVGHMLKSLEDHTPNTVNRLATEIVEKFTKQLRTEKPGHDTKDTGTPISTPVQSPVISTNPNWPLHGRTEDLKLNAATDSHSEHSKVDVGNTSDTSETDLNSTVPVTSSKYKGLQDKKPGVCLYIVELEFEPEDENFQAENRHSSFPEFKKMKGAFEGLGCYVKKLTNPTKQAAEQFLNEAKKWCDNLKPGFFVLIISTHGQEVPVITKENSSDQEKSSEGTNKTRFKKEMVHQLFFHDGHTLSTKEIIQIFEPLSCPCTFFIQACRSRFGIINHVNYDKGVAVLLKSNSGNMPEESQPETDSEDALKDIPLTDTVDARPSNTKLSNEDEEKRIRDITASYKMTEFQKYMTWLKSNDATSTASKDDSKEVQQLREALKCDVFKPQETEEIMVLCKGYEKYTLDFFYPEPTISDPAPCTNDSLVMFASAPGKEAYNRERQGGWLITNLEAQIKETLNQKPEKVDLLAELIKVSGRIAFNYETETSRQTDSGHKSVPCLYHRLSEDIIIWPEEMKKAKQLAEKEGSDWKEFSNWDPNTDPNKDEQARIRVKDEV
ncbi:uncharacterized protein LOC128155499 isoform X2 [Crassostrea angulata]|uniref:uncharacterized protein LOC128155499 isoform X2 n=1 Tax=Magallana angulata TaxID=2784310 RepID=UPI0022B0A48F|nr:uncharacterized protein LOC128155499 isoform X2 [Crassostrea angulata]